MSEIKIVGLYGAEHSKCNCVMILGFKGLNRRALYGQGRGSRDMEEENKAGEETTSASPLHKSWIHYSFINIRIKQVDRPQLNR